MDVTEPISGLQFGGFEDELIQKDRNHQKSQHGECMGVQIAPWIEIALKEREPGNAGGQQIRQ